MNETERKKFLDPRRLVPGIHLIFFIIPSLLFYVLVVTVDVSFNLQIVFVFFVFLTEFICIGDFIAFIFLFLFKKRKLAYGFLFSGLLLILHILGLLSILILKIQHEKAPPIPLHFREWHTSRRGSRVVVIPHEWNSQCRHSRHAIRRRRIMRAGI